MIRRFIRQFTSEKFDITEIDNDFYIIPENLKSTRQKTFKKPHSIGTFLGKTKNERFYPSLALLELLAKTSDKKLVINKKAEWLFLCGRDLFGRSIISSNTKKGLVLVQNEKDENLGYGKIIDNIAKKDKIVVKNLLDRGDFLRREQ